MKNGNSVLLALLVLVAVLVAQPASAKEMYVRAAVGAAGTWAGDAMTVRSDYSSQLSSTDRSFLSFGRGVGLDAAFGIELADHLCGELGIGYLVGVPFEKQSTYASETMNSFETTTYRGQMFRLTPALRIGTQIGNLKPYGRLGVAIAVPSVTESEDRTSDGKRTLTEAEYSGGITLGLTGAGGVEFPLSGKVSLVVEANFTSMTYSPTNAKLTKRTQDGVDLLPSMTTSEKEVEFTDKRVSSGPSTQNQGSPDQASSIAMPFSNVGIAVGLAFGF